MPRRREPRHPFSYPVARLFLRVGLGLQTLVPLLPEQPDPEGRACTEALLVQHFHLEEAIAERWISAYRFRWHPRGKLLSIDLTLHRTQRRVPTIPHLRRLYWPHVTAGEAPENGPETLRTG